MNGAERRYICRACGFTHDAWAPRCSECLSLEGLKGVGAALEPAAAGRLVCRACGFAHETWAPRCTRCLSLEGLKSEEASQEAPTRPHLVIVPDLMPDPELDDPAYELAEDDDDVIIDDEAIPLSEVPDTLFVRYSTGLPPLDHVLGGGLVAASAVLLASPRGIGKCLGLGTPVLMFDGRVMPVEHVLPGDLLMGPDGKQRTVLATSAGFGGLYRIDPIKGDPWICNDEHVLTLVNGLTNEVIDVPLSEWLAKTPYSDLRQHGRLFSVGVENFGGGEQQTERPIDPYFLGVWFGDGTKATVERTTGELLAKVQITKPDDEILKLCEEQGRLWGLRVHTYEDGTKRKSYQLVADEAPEGGGRWLPNPLLRALRDLVGPEIKIPETYLRGPREVRLQFLAGFCDTDGELASKTFVISQKREDWARALWWLARSLGFCATIRSRKAGFVRADGSRFEGTYWTVIISGNTDQIPTRLPRKKALPRQQIKVATRTGFTAESIGEGPYFGFTLDGDGRFLLGDFTVTHNSSLTLQMLDGLGHRCLYVTGEETREQLAGTARRIGAASNKIYVFVERHIEKIFDKARAVRAKTIAIDSIQKMVCADVNGRAGSPGQVKECTARLVQYAKDTGTALWIIGHVTSDGDVAGPSTIEHDVDVVLELEQGTSFDGNERILRCTGKNRFGPANLVGSFELTGTGFVPVDGDGWDEKL